MSYAIKITDSKTGEILTDEQNATAIVGSYITDEKVNRMAYIHCGRADLCIAVDGAKETIKAILTKFPEIALLLKFAEKDLAEAHAKEDSGKEA